MEEDDEVFEMFCDVELLVGGLVAEDEVLLGGVAEVVVAGAEVEVLVEVVVIVEADVEVVELNDELVVLVLVVADIFNRDSCYNECESALYTSHGGLNRTTLVVGGKKKKKGRASLNSALLNCRYPFLLSAES